MNKSKAYKQRCLYALLLFMALNYLFLFNISYAEESIKIKEFIGKKAIIRIDSIPLIQEYKCSDKYFPKGIISSWYYDINDDDTFDISEDIFHLTYNYARKYGNWIYIRYDTLNNRQKTFFSRCTHGEIINETKDEIWYLFSNNDFDLYIGYRFDSEKDYLVKYISFTPKKDIFVFSLKNVFELPFYGEKYNIFLFPYFLINNKKIKISEGCDRYHPEVSGKTKIFPLKNTSLFLYRKTDNGMGVLFSRLCSSNTIEGSIEIFLPNIHHKSFDNIWRIYFASNIITNLGLSKDQTIFAKIIYFYRKNDETLSSYVDTVLTQEKCDGYATQDNTQTKQKFVLHSNIPLYDSYSLEGLTFSNAFKLKYLTSITQDKPYYYLYNTDPPTYSGIKINRDLLIKLCKENNITTYSSCSDITSKLFVGAIAYHNRGVYIEDYKNADIYLCGEEAEKEYFRTFNQSIYGISIIPFDLKWKNLAILYANKSYLYLVDNAPTSDEIKNIIRKLFSYDINKNPYFKLNGLFIILFGDENQFSDLSYGNMDEDDFIEIGVGIIPYPFYPKERFMIKNALLMAEYEQPTSIAFINKYNGMFTSLIARKWFSMYGVNVKRYVERRAEISKIFDEGKENYEKLKEIISAILAKKAISGGSLYLAIYGISEITSEILQAIHELNYEKISLQGLSISDLYKGDLFEENLSLSAFDNLREYDFFGYFGRIKDGTFVYPDVDVHILPSFKGMFYLDYDSTYDIGKHLFKKGGFGIVLTSNKHSRYAQERFGNFARFLLTYDENIGNALRDSANLIIAKNDIFERLGISHRRYDEGYGRILLGDPTIKILTPLKRKEEKLDKEQIITRKYRSLKSSIRLASYNEDISNKIITIKTYSFEDYFDDVNITELLNQNVLAYEDFIFTDVLFIPHVDNYTLKYNIHKEILNKEKVSDNLLNCSPYTYSLHTINGKIQLFILIPIICKEKESIYKIKNLSFYLEYAPDIKIMNIKNYGRYLYLDIFSSFDKLNKSLIIYNTEKNIWNVIPVSLKKGNNKLMLDKRQLMMQRGRYYFIIGNSSFYLDLSSVPSLYITEIYPNPPNEELEFIEVYYNDIPLYNTSITIYENKNHTLLLDLVPGYYVFVRNKTLFMEEFDILENMTSRVIEVNKMRLNNKGEEIAIYHKGILVDNFSYTPSSCCNKEICSIHIAYNTTYEDIPSPLYEKKILSALNETRDTNKKDKTITATLLTSKVFKGGKIKIKIKKKYCDLKPVNIAYTIGNITKHYIYDILCSKTAYLDIPYELKAGYYMVNLSISMENESSSFSFPIEIFNETTLLCNFSISIYPYKNTIDKDETLNYKIILDDSLCFNVEHPISIIYLIEDGDGNTLYEKETFTDIICHKELKRKLKFNSHITSKMTHPLIKIKAKIENPFCNSLSSLTWKESEIVYKGSIKREISTHANSDKNEKSHSTFVPSMEREDNMKSKLIVDTIIFKDSEVYIIINNTDRKYVTLYSYIINKDNNLLSYYCNTSNNITIKGWKANLKFTNKSRILLKMCIKPEANLNGSKIRIKYSFDNKTFYVIEKDMPYIYYIESDKIEKETNKSNITDINKKQIYKYRCFVYDDKVAVEIIPLIQNLTITIEKEDGNSTEIINNERLFILKNNEKLYIESKYINCSYETKRLKHKTSVIRRIINAILRLLGKIFH